MCPGKKPHYDPFRTKFMLVVEGEEEDEMEGKEEDEMEGKEEDEMEDEGWRSEMRDER